MKSIINFKNDEILVDGKNDWKCKKLMSDNLSESYLRLAKSKKIERFYDLSWSISNCTTFLDFKRREDGTKKLVRSNFCRARLCPMCSWRKSKKIFGQVSNILKEMTPKENLEYIFLTLTYKNVVASELESQMDKAIKAFNFLMKNARVKKMCKGYFRGVEVTYNELSKTYNPHIHCIIAVNPSYFTDKTYIKQMDWRLLWQRYLDIDYLPQIWIEKFKQDSYKAVAEASKYTVKSKDMFVYQKDGSINEPLTDEIIYTLHFALKSKRLVGMGGFFKKYHKLLNLEDMNKDDIDLVNTDINDEKDVELTEKILRYKWFVGLNNYYLQKE